MIASPGFVSYWHNYEDELLYYYPAILAGRAEIIESLVDLAAQFPLDIEAATGFVHVDTSPAPNTTIAHEVGHGAFSLLHSSGLGAQINLMTQGAQTKWRLFKGQWDAINP